VPGSIKVGLGPPGPSLVVTRTAEIGASLLVDAAATNEEVCSETDLVVTT